MIYIYTTILTFTLLNFACSTETPSLKKAYEDKFLMGVALSSKLINHGDKATMQMINHQFNAVVAENCMKSKYVQPEEGVFDFTEADKLVEIGENNNMKIIGHTLVWHSQTPEWLFVDKEGNDVSREVLIERMRNHIYTVVGKYKGRIHGWDVVNEGFTGFGALRKTKWLEIIGDDYIELAFKFAHEADPEAELYYNDYGMDSPGKRTGVVNFVKKLQGKGIAIHGIGMQGHYALNVSPDEVEKSIVAFSDLGIQVMITELDITVLPFPSKKITADLNQKHKYMKELNPYPEELPDSIQQKLTNSYVGLFRVFIKHEDAISRVTFWGLNDGESWKNNWPVKGRTNYPLLFDRNNMPKPAFDAVINLVK